MEDNVIHMKDFVGKTTERKILEAIDMSEEALGKRNYELARQLFDRAYRFYGKAEEVTPDISNRIDNLEMDLFFR